MERIYTIVRKDLSPGLQIAQAGHALRAFAAEHPELDKQWYEGGNNLVVLWADDEVALRLELERLRAEGLRCAAFHEPDLSEQLTAIAVEGSARKLVRHYPLAFAA